MSKGVRDTLIVQSNYNNKNFASRVEPYPARIVWPCYFNYIGLVDALK